MSFRDILKKDISAVFHNSDEFSDIKEIWYNGGIYQVPAVVSKYQPEPFESSDYRRNGRSYGDGIYQVSEIAYIPYDALGLLPSVNNRIDIGGISYNIMSAELLQNAEIVLTLERYDE